MWICKISGCDNLVKAIGLCEKHYARKRRNGHPLRLINSEIKICTIKGCRLKCHARYYCKKHYQRYVERARKNEKFI